MQTSNFSTLPLPDSILRNLSALGLTAMTPIQSESLPHILQKRDVIARAKTGSGKTAAFGIGLLTQLDVKKRVVQSLILCPTRELADQVAKELRRLARLINNIKILTLCGGEAFGPQFGSLRHGAHIVVGTPGRILKHLAKGSLSLDDLEVLTLDEAHRMLDMGFIEEINKIIKYAPTNRQTLLFSATYPEEIMELSSSIQQNAVNIQTISRESANKITEYFYKVAPDDKLSTLIKIFAEHKPENALVFSNTKLGSREIAESLQKKWIKALAIHGDLEQYERADALTRFANRSCSVMVATDVAARGLHIKKLDMVINYDMPADEATYIHRIGRTGRAGEEGLAFTLFTGREALAVDKYRNDARLFENAESLSGQENFSMKAPNITIVIEGGRKDKVRPGDILGSLTGEHGVAGKYVGDIDIYDRQSYVAIKRGVIDKAYSKLKNGKIKGRKFPVWILN